MLWWTLYQAEGVLMGSWLRRMALAECMRHIHYEARDGPPVSTCVMLMSIWRVSAHASFMLV